MGNDKIKFYLDYLDKEMTIMGILSTFCVATLGLVIDKLIFNDTKSIFHNCGNGINWFCVLGFAALLSAALFFYRQRSLLAMYFGQISFYVSLSNDQKINHYLNEVYGWDKWISYEGGFSSLYLAFLEFGCVLLQKKGYAESMQGFLPWILLLLFVLRYLLARYAYRKYSKEDDPILKSFPWLKKIINL